MTVTRKAANSQQGYSQDQHSSSELGAESRSKMPLVCVRRLLSIHRVTRALFSQFDFVLTALEPWGDEPLGARPPERAAEGPPREAWRPGCLAHQVFTPLRGGKALRKRR